MQRGEGHAGVKSLGALINYLYKSLRSLPYMSDIMASLHLQLESVHESF